MVEDKKIWAKSWCQNRIACHGLVHVYIYMYIYIYIYIYI